MNLLKNFNLQRRQVEALERIARALEMGVLSQHSKEGALFSFSQGGDPNQGRFYAQPEEDFQEIEKEQLKHPDLVRQEEWLEEQGR